MRKRLTYLLLTAVWGLLAAAVASPARQSSGAVVDRQPRFPIRAAFYYPWFPETWRKGDRLFSKYHSSLGEYASANRTVIRRHVAAMRYGGIEAGIVSWFGRGHRSDRRLATILAVTDRMRSRFRWTIYYEQEGYGDPSSSRIASDLTYVERRFGDDRAYLRVGGRPVVFVWADGGNGCGMAGRWREGTRGLRLHLVLKLFHGYRGCQTQPDSWHEYAPAHSPDVRGTDSFTISPGFWLASENRPRLPRDLERFRADARRMAKSRARWQLVTTFNEWGEGTAVESAREWASRSGYGDYLDALHEAR